MTLLNARGVRKEYGKGDALLRAVDDVDLDVTTGETVAIIGIPAGLGLYMAVSNGAAVVMPSAE